MPFPRSFANQDWRPGASLANLRLRARMMRRAREFFALREILEVATPALQRCATTDPLVPSIRVSDDAAGHGRFLHTSPEHAMKRLLCAGSGDIYQMCRVFREHERGALHNPEFTMIEWYRVGYDHHRLATEVVELLASLLERPLRSESCTYREAFVVHAGFDPFEESCAGLRGVLAARGVALPSLPAQDRDAWLDLTMSTLVIPALGHDCATVVYDYPATQAALARIRPGATPVAERFEVFLGGLELANGFRELGDADEQAQRFAAENAARVAAGSAPVPVDMRLLGALAAGLPDCAGVALGLDRVLMLAAGSKRIDEVLAFSADSV